MINNAMKKNLTVAAVGLVLAMPIVADETRKAPDQSGVAGETRSVLDQRGVAVDVPKEVKKMVVFAGPLPSVVFAIDGSTNSIVGASPWSVTAAKDGMMATMSPEIFDAKTDFLVGNAGVNMEELMKLEPDVLIAWLDEPEALNDMEKAGLSVIGVDVMGKGQSQKHFEEWLRILGEIYDKEERANQLLSLQRETIAEMEKRVTDIPLEERPRVLVVAKMGEGLIKVRGGEDDHHYFWISRSGGQSVAKELPGGRQHVSMEQVLAWDPEVIYLRNWNDVTPQDLYDN